ncbi:MAG: HAD-IIB family hydrolase [Thermoflexibacter sp.]|nr:HAD-IIB family hydrolase [Thermoflexibacter sp.]
MHQYVIYSDLDGTILDINNYSHEQSEKAIGLLKKYHIPLIFCSTKTFAEQVYYQKILGIYAPFIIENGSAIFIPKDYFSFAYQFSFNKDDYNVIELGKPVELIRHAIREVNQNLGFNLRGFNNMPIDELVRIVGLDKEKINNALAKDYTKTLVNSLSENEAIRINEELIKQGLTLCKGSKYHSVMSASTDKGKAVSILNKLFESKYPQFISIGIGDGANDASMFSVVDNAFLVQRYKGFWENIYSEKIKKIEGVGGKGFEQVIMSIVN